MLQVDDVEPPLEAMIFCSTYDASALTLVDACDGLEDLAGAASGSISHISHSARLVTVVMPARVASSSVSLRWLRPTMVRIIRRDFPTGELLS